MQYISESVIILYMNLNQITKIAFYKDLPID